MSRSRSIPLLVLSALIPLAAGCGRSDRPTANTESAGSSTPIVSATSTTGSSETTGGVSTAPVSYEQAESAFGAGHYPEATRLFTSYTDSNPENPWGYYMLGVSAWRSGNHE